MNDIMWEQHRSLVANNSTYKSLYASYCKLSMDEDTVVIEMLADLCNELDLHAIEGHWRRVLDYRIAREMRRGTYDYASG